MRRSLSHRGGILPIVGVLVIIVLAALFFVLGTPEEGVWRVEVIAPKCILEVARVGGTEWKTVNVGAWVPPLSQVRLTASDESLMEAKALLRFTDDSEILVTPGTEVTLTEVTRFGKVLKNIEMQVLKGFCGFKVSKNPERPVKVKTAHSITSVLGTTFYLKVVPEKTTLRVDEGKVQFQKTSGGASPIIVEAPQTVDSDSGAPASFSKFFQRDEFWNMPYGEMKKIINQL